jgi:hypothetical protein
LADPSRTRSKRDGQLERVLAEVEGRGRGFGDAGGDGGVGGAGGSALQAPDRGAVRGGAPAAHIGRAQRLPGPLVGGVRPLLGLPPALGLVPGPRPEPHDPAVGQSQGRPRMAPAHPHRPSETHPSRSGPNLPSTPPGMAG